MNQLPTQIRYDERIPHYKEILIDKADVFNEKIVFFHEIAFFRGLNTMKPWDENNVYHCIQTLYMQWDGLKVKLQIDINNRNKTQIEKGMIHGIEIFLECLYWCNNEPVSFENGIINESLVIKPFNVEERVLFILSRMNGYHSFKQLEELYKELEKQIAVKRLKQNRLNNK